MSKKVQYKTLATMLAFSMLDRAKPFDSRDYLDNSVHRFGELPLLTVFIVAGELNVQPSIKTGRKSAAVCARHGQPFKYPLGPKTKVIPIRAELLLYPAHSSLWDGDPDTSAEGEDTADDDGRELAETGVSAFELISRDMQAARLAAAKSKAEKKVNKAQKRLSPKRVS